MKTFILFLCITVVLLAQTPKGKMSEKKDLVMNSNNIQTVLYNYGSISAPGALSDIKDFVWNDLGYIYEFGTLIGAEVVNDDDDTLRIISDSFVDTREGDYNADKSVKWGWLPVEGYSNQNSNNFANRLDTLTWPENWSSWSGEYGMEKITAVNEAFYKMNDFTNAEFNYYPFDNDTTKRGLGVSAEVRVYQFGGGLKDALIVKYFIKNESDKDLENVYFGFWGDPHIGGVGDNTDDRVHIINSVSLSNSVNNTIYLWDNDFIGRAGKHPEYLSFRFLETPDNKGLTSFNVMKRDNYKNVPKNDSLMWKNFTGGIDTLNYLYSNSGDNVINFGTGPFNLLKGETKIVKLVIFFSHSIQDVIADAKYISLQHNWPTIGTTVNESGGNENYKIELSSIPVVINGNYEVTWNFLGTASNNTKVFLEYSFNKGLDWFPLVTDSDINNSYVWNTENTKDGKNYILRIVAYNKDNPQDYYYYISSERFTLDNPEVNAQPELETNFNFEEKTITNSPLNINWISEDADDSELNIKIEYSIDEKGPYTEILSQTYNNGENSFNWDIKDLPNTKSCFVKITASDGVTDTTMISERFSIDIFQNKLSKAHIKSYRGNATPEIIIQTVDNSLITSDEYSLLFHINNNEKTFDVKNITQNKVLLTNYPLNDSVSTPAIDGMKITVKDFANDINYTFTRFVSENLGPQNYNIEFPAVLGNNKIKVDDDYLIVFNDFDTLTDGSWKMPDTMQTQLGEVLAPFSFWNIKGEAPNFTSKIPATYILYEPIEPNRNNGRWDLGEYLILQPQGATDASTSYQISFNFSNNILPKEGDSLYIITFNQIENNDEFRFSPDSTVVKVKTGKISDGFKLYQNYPNPFNPTTTIQYSIPVGTTHELPHQQHVLLRIYNILGKEVATLVNQKQKPGKYLINFNATNLSSGIYFYKLQSGKYIQTKKMLLLK